MIALRVLAIALGHSRRRPGLTAAALLAAAVAAGGLSYIVGDASSRNERLLEGLRTPLARSILIRAASTASPEDLLNARDVQTLASMPGIEHAVGLSAVESATNAAIPGATTSIGFFDITVLSGANPYRLVAGRVPRDGEVIISEPGAGALAATIPLASGLAVGHRVLPVVGVYQTLDEGRLTQLLSSSSIATSSANIKAYALVALVVRQPSDLAAIIRTLPVIFSDRVPSDYNAEFDPRLKDIEETISLAGRQSIRSTALAITAFGAVIEAVVTAVNALTQRREIARRRALGATRSAILSVLVVESAVLSTIGATIGAASAVAVLAVRHEQIALGLPFSAAIFVAIAATAAAVPGGLFGAFQDPATILRVA